MVADRAYRDRVLPQLQQCAPVTARAMFGGWGLYNEGVMFALLADEQIYFKVDDANRPDFEAAGMVPFVYWKGDRPVQMSFYQLPESVLADPAELAGWLDRATAAARRAKQRRRR